MGQAIAIIIIIVILIFTFVPLAELNSNHMDVQNLKQNLNLAARALAYSIDKNDDSLEILSEGYWNTNTVVVDKGKLIREFDKILEMNYDGEKYNDIKSRLLLKVLVYADRFYVADYRDIWSQPYFFTMDAEVQNTPPVDATIYFSILNDNIYYYESNGSKKTEKSEENPYKIADALYNGGTAIDRTKKNDVIINKINEVVSRFVTVQDDDKGTMGLSIKVRNPDKADNTDYKLTHQFFNVLEGTTFFVIYVEDKNINVSRKNYHFKNYNVAGFTLKTYFQGRVPLAQY